LSFEFFFLPPGVVQSSPEAKHYGVLNFSGDRIGSEPDRTSTASPLPISHAAAIGDASAAYVPLNQTSPNKNLSISISKYVETYDKLHVNVPLRVIAETPIKVFMILNDQNFSLTTNTGNRCHIGTLYGLYTFDQSFPDNTDAMQVVGPNSFQPSNPMAYCDRQLASNDKFVLSIQLSTLPADVVQSTPAAKQFVPASFTLDNIGLAP
jgi:hypothetical protein